MDEKMRSDNRKYLVIGAGKSGIASAKFLHDVGATVVLSDSKSRENASADVLALESEGVVLCLGEMPADPSWFDKVIISPGVPLTIPYMAELAQAEVPVIGELELAYLYASNPFIAITGTNGKTTTTSLVGHIFASAGHEAVVGGNIGEPLIKHVDEMDDEGMFIAEVSSFQLETAYRFHAHIGAFLNLTPDHLNRHITMENYGDIKARIFGNQTYGDYAVMNYDDLLVREYAKKVASRVCFFSGKEILDNGVCLVDGYVVACRDSESRKIMAVSDIFIKGEHNIENALAAITIALAAHIPDEEIAAAVASFKGVEHRQEFVCTKNGVTYVNDSKGTNPDSTIMAIKACPGGIVLILGGKPKGSDFTDLVKLVNEKVGKVILVGEAALEIEAALVAGGFADFEHAGMDFENCVKLAIESAKDGDTVLLSPACASWDMFAKFEDRGDLFKELVGRLA